MNLTLENLIQKFDDLISGNSTPEEISNWAKEKQSETDKGCLIYVPSNQKSLMWSAINYLNGVDLKSGPDEFLHSRENFVLERIRFCSQVGITKFSQFDTSSLLATFDDSTEISSDLSNKVKNLKSIVGYYRTLSGEIDQYYFLSPLNPNQPNSKWQFKENISINCWKEGELIFDIMRNGDIGALEIIWNSDALKRDFVS